MIHQTRHVFWVATVFAIVFATATAKSIQAPSSGPAMLDEQSVVGPDDLNGSIPNQTCAKWAFKSILTEDSCAGTGNATIDTAAINAAISHGTAVYFPPGTYIYNGSMTLPAGKSFRLYGDGPRNSIIKFNGPLAGINAFNMTTNTLEVEGLTLMANSGTGNAGTAIYGNFNSGAKYQSATIRNVQIMPSDTGNTPSGYWNYGIDLYQASNSVIENVQIHGKFDWVNGTPISDTGIFWHSASTYATTQLFVHDLYVSYFKKGVSTSGHIEGLYMSQFELVFDGSATTGAMDITGATETGAAVPAFHIINGHINQITNGIKMSNLVSIQISHVNFLNIIGTGNHIALTNVGGANISENGFVDYDCASQPCTPITIGNGIYLLGTTGGVRMCGNGFNLNNEGGGSAIVVSSTCHRNAILDNDFGDSLHQINDMSNDTHIRLITFP